MLLFSTPTTLHHRVQHAYNTTQHTIKHNINSQARICAASSLVNPTPAINTRCRASTTSQTASASSADSVSNDDTLGVVIVDHGSKRAASNEMLVEFVSLYQRTTGCTIVEPAHMEIAKPSIADAVDKCVARGATRIVVAPYFLSRGRHIQDDIPALVKEAQQQHPSVPCIIAEPIGVDATMAQIIHSRVAAALDTAQPSTQQQPA